MVRAAQSDANDPLPSTIPGDRPATDTLVGTKLGKYSIQRLIGNGGMGAVYDALDTFLKRRVAIKVLPDSVAASPDGLRRFVFEARAFAQVNHPNAVSIYEVDRRNGIVYIVLELMRGGSLLDLLQSKGALEWPQATQAVIDACKALVATHSAGLIHRDVKPANLMLSGTGIVKLADFGLAKFSEGAAAMTSIAGRVIGTPHYMSPEQCRGEAIDFRTDVYALGATYYTLLTHQTPFKGDLPVQVLFAHCASPIPDPRQANSLIPQACSDIIARAMAKEQSERYGSAAQMLADLESLMSAGTQFVFNSETDAGQSAADAELVALALQARQTDQSAENQDPSLALPEQSSVPDTPPHAPDVPRGSHLGFIACTILAVATVAALTLLIAFNFRLWPFIPAGPSLAVSRSANDGVNRPATAPVSKKTNPATQPYNRVAATRPFPNRLNGQGYVFGTGPRISSVAFSNDGTRLAVGRDFANGGLQIWNTQAASAPPALSFDFPVRSLSFAAGGHQLIAAAGPKGIMVRDWKNDTICKPAGADKLGSVDAIAFSKGGGTLAAAAHSDTDHSIIHLWEVRTWHESRKFVIPMPTVESIVFSPDNEFMCLAGGDRVTIWRLKGNQPLLFLPGTTSVNAIAISANGEILAVGGDTGVDFWDPSTMLRATPRWSCPAKVNALAFSSDSRLLATACEDGFVRCWRVAQPKEVSTQRLHRNAAATAVAFANGFHILASGGADGTIHVIDVNRKLETSQPTK